MSAQPHPAIPTAIWHDVQSRLDRIRAAHDVRLLLAVESGSRAWGFPSPDSDYDIRFVYVRSRDWYLQLRPGRDVIETAIEDDIDLNGWDIRKALGLLLKSNAVIGEWIASPIRYRMPHPIVDRLELLAKAVMDPRRQAHHYASVARNAADRWLDGDGPVPVKKYFYALRPALAIRCLRLQPSAPPPMHLNALITAARLPDAIVGDIAQMVEAKRRAKEAAETMRITSLDTLIRDELAQIPAIPGGNGVRPEDMAEADNIFLELVNT